jgi:hypothetical protein
MSLAEGNKLTGISRENVTQQGAGKEKMKDLYK